MPIRYLKHLTHIPCRIKVLWGVNPRFHGLYPGIRQVAYALLTRAPVAIKVLLPHDAPRLACVKPVASVHPEPGSNSSLFKLLYLMLRIRIYFQVIDGINYNTCTTCWYVNLSKNFRFHFDCGCKGKDFFLTAKFFRRKIEKFFSSRCGGWNFA